MSSTHLDSFLPSGGVEYKPRDPSTGTSSTISPLTVPRHFSASGLMSPPHNNNSLSSQGKPISPPQSRSPSADNASAAMVEDWRTYTANLRSQYKGERAHMDADRARMEEVMDEERALWELERSYWVAQVAELEAKVDTLARQVRLASSRPQGPTSQPMSTASSSAGGLPKSSAHTLRKLSNSSHESHSSAHNVPQESGRDENGAPFYAPAPQNPSRTWASDASSVRLDSISCANEDDVLQVANKELTASDFKHSSPGSECLSPILESSTPSIDISFIQPGLEGVSIKASAVNPTFAAKILSPVQSPNSVPSRPDPISLDEKTSPPSANSRPSLSRSTSRSTTSPEGRAIKTLEVVSAPENRRLTMNAGHTPNHSISKLPWLNEADGEATPKASQPIIFKGAIDRRASLALSLVSVPDDEEEEENGDKELTGPLGLVGDASVDNPFLVALTEKLEEVKRSSEPTSPRGSETSVDEEDEEDEIPRLRLKSSGMNFGAPMGSL